MTDFYFTTRRYYFLQEFVVGKVNIFITTCIIHGGLLCTFLWGNAVVRKEFTIIFLFSSGSG